MMQGTPYIYQGEELGMTNIYFDSIDDYKDIECIDNYRELTESGLISKEDMIRYLGLRGRDNARTPMQWSDSPNAGFTVGTPWIKVNRIIRKSMRNHRFPINRLCFIIIKN